MSWRVGGAGVRLLPVSFPRALSLAPFVPATVCGTPVPDTGVCQKKVGEKATRVNRCARKRESKVQTPVLGRSSSSWLQLPVTQLKI